MYTDAHSSCIQIHHNAICQCVSGYHSVNIQKPNRKTFCAEGTKTYIRFYCIEIQISYQFSRSGRHDHRPIHISWRYIRNRSPIRIDMFRVATVQSKLVFGTTSLW